MPLFGFVGVIYFQNFVHFLTVRCRTKHKTWSDGSQKKLYIVELGTIC